MNSSVPAPDGDLCSIAASLGVLGEKWTLLVLREAFSGIRRFEDMLQRTGAPRQVLSARLARLVDEGILRRVPYREAGQRQRAEYRLTDKGLDLYPILVALMHWGDRWAIQTAVPPLTLHHRGCGAEVGLQLRCAAGHDLAGARDVQPLPAEPAQPGRPRLAARSG
ncbi:MAG TPA: helix-turn-helix domain-containing protein [Pilimelia sp.]|nr:helix-turn-helix domain-containing protein [Pilimelia sp.]